MPNSFPFNEDASTEFPLLSINFPEPNARISNSDFGFQGKLVPFLSERTASVPFAFKTEPSGFKMTRFGIPWTLNFFDSAAFLSLSEKGSAFQGISPKYSLKSASDLSDEMNTISKFFPSSVNFLYSSARTGVNPRHGGHQCAEK